MAVARNAKAKKPTPLNLAREFGLGLLTPEGRQTFHPSVNHTAKAWWPRLGEADVYGIRHTFDLEVPEYHFEFDTGPNDEAAEAASDVMRRRLAAYAIEAAPDVLNDERLLVARLEIDELPAHLVEQMGGWFHVMGCLGDEGPSLGELAERVSDSSDDQCVDFSLIDGAFLWPKTLAVHPKCRGRQIGIRLLAHALWILHRSGGDIAAFEIGSLPGCFQVPQARQTRDYIRRMKRYYARIGFLPWPGEKAIVYLPMGKSGMPVKGLGALTFFPKQR